MANKKIGAGIALDGEKEFKQAVSNINKDLSILGSEMKKVTAQFDGNDKSMESLTAQSNVYNRQIVTQTQKIETLKKAYNNANETLDKCKENLEEVTKKHGEGSEEVKKAQEAYDSMQKKVKDWQISLNKAEAELYKTEKSLRDTQKEMDDFGKESDDAGKEVEKAGKKAKNSGDDAEKGGSGWSKLGSIVKGAAVAIGAAAVAAGAAAIKLGKDVVTAYADYEQLVGGVDTLFGESSAKVQEYAANAYKTAGLSANDYMETVTSFSASLLQSLGGDTSKAADAADIALTDMSDNANKMGTSLDSIQNAYQGFAKQNYTMLDNLKLGYGGTKTEMERLLADAEKLSGQKYDISSLNDVYSAIHVVQTEMGITGTTAKEASDTIGGSISSMKSAIGNLITGLGDSNANIDMLIGNVMESFQNVAKNITPIVQNIISALPAVLDGVLKEIGNMLPSLLSTATDLFKRLLDTILKLLPELIPVAVQALLTIADTLIEAIPLLLDCALVLIMSLAEGLVQALPTMIPKLVEVVLYIVETLVNNIDKLLDAAIEIIIALADGIINAIPILIEKLPIIVIKVVNALINAIPKLLAIVPKIFTSLVDTFKKTDWASIGKNILDGVIDGLKNAVKNIGSAIKSIGNTILGTFKSFFGIKSPSRLFRDQVGKYLADGIGLGFTDEMDKVTQDMTKAIPTNFDTTINAGFNNPSLSPSGQFTANGEIYNVINIDGRSFASVITPYVSKRQYTALGGAF
jgi:phage-related protein/flagellar biosynthesis chaperone FliJ|nr:MAG TPA: tail tape measure protein [Caudoviricetes sp.]